MRGLVPRIHDLRKDMDGRDKPGRDDKKQRYPPSIQPNPLNRTAVVVIPWFSPVRCLTKQSGHKVYRSDYRRQAQRPLFF